MRVAIPVWGWVLASRLLVLSAGVSGSLLFGRVQGWSSFDSARLTTSFGSLGNALTASSVRWDSLNYLKIAEHGYPATRLTSFFPFYPLLIHVVAWLVGSDVIAGLFVSTAAFLIALLLLHRLACEELGTEAADATVLLLAFAPLSLFFTAIYTESLLLALSVGTFYLARHGHFRLACMTAACATLTHVEGGLLIAPLAWIYCENRVGGGRFDIRALVSWDLTALTLPLLAILGFSFYMHQIGFGWASPIIGPESARHAVVLANDHHLDADQFNRSVVGPVVTIWRALIAGLQGLRLALHGSLLLAPATGDLFTPSFQNLIYLVILGIALAALVGAWRRLPAPYAIYATLVILLFTMSVVTLIPLRSFDRYMLPVFPLWMSVGAWLRERRLLPTTLQISALMLIFYTVEFARWAAVA